MLDRVVVFFYLSLLDEAQSKEAIQRSIKTYRQSDLRVEDLIRLMHEGYQKHFAKARPVGSAFSSGQLILPDGLKWNVWLEFHRLADRNDLVALLLNKILGFSEASVAEGLQVSQGTVRFRVAKALRLLGGLSA